MGAMTQETASAPTSPMTMHLLTRFEKADAATRTDICLASALAVVRLLAHPDAAPDRPWHEPIARWEREGIRKHSRRARPAAYAAAATLPGVEAQVGTARVRALVPAPLEDTLVQVRKMQLTGSEPADPAAAAKVPARLGAVVITLTPQPALPLGKAAAAAGHAAQLAYREMTAQQQAAWQANGFAMLLEQPAVPLWRKRILQAPVQVVDAGHTVVEPGTTTALARWALRA